MVITLIGKVLGLYRDRLLAVHYSTGPTANAFFTASRIPRVFFDAVFASAIAACFIPVFSEYLEKKGKKEAFRFAGAFLTVITLLTGALTLVGMLFPQPLVALFADYSDSQTTALAVSLTRVMFPTVLFSGIAFSLVGVLQAQDHFTAPALMSAVSNLVIILYFITLDGKLGIYGLAGAYLLGWFLQGAIQVPPLLRLGCRLHPSLDIRSEGMKKLLALMGPVMVSTWVQPINQAISARFGSRLYEGAGVAALEYASNLYLVIAGTFILSITNVIFPKLSRLTAGGREGEFQNTIRQTLSISLFFVLPMSVGLMAVARPLISLIYGGGQFDAFSTGITASALGWMALGMGGYALQNILSRAYFAKQQGRVPLIAGGAAILVNVALCGALARRFSVAGLAFSSAVSSTVYALLLLLPLQREGERLLNAGALWNLLKMALASAVMGLCVWTALGAAAPRLPGGKPGELISLALSAGLGAVLYFLLALLLRVDEAKMAVSLILRQGDAPSPESGQPSSTTQKRGQAMERASNILNASLLWRCLMALCRWCGEQWRSSGVVQWFLHPRGWTPAASESSVFFKLWSLIRRGLCWLYEALRLDKLFAGSVFTQCWFWCAIPVVIAPLLSDRFHPSLVTAGLALVGGLSVLLCLVRNRERQLAWSPINRYILLYAAIYLAGTLFSVNLRSSLRPGLLSVVFVLFSLVLYNAVTNRNQLDTLLSAAVLVGMAVAAYGILQYLFRWGYQDQSWVDSDMFFTIEFRVPSTLGNPNMLGQYLILIIPVGGAKLLSAKDWPKRGFYLICCALMCVCMILTFSRGAWLGLLFAGAVFVLLLNPRLILLAPVALAALWFVLPDTVISRFTSIGNMTDGSTTYRVSIWLATVDMLKHYWPCGIGPGSTAFNMVYPAYAYSDSSAQHAHNLFLQLMCDAGVTLLILFLIVLFVYFRMMCTAVSQEKDWTSRLYQAAFAGGVCGFLVQAMTDYSFYNYRVLLLFWTYLAMGALSARRSRLPEGRLMV
ncbi:MAG: murein biosynthesis integral membrane protein MurJ [Lawsonibacter sp.]|nr:murein biosynthesis integral membrane protein MurJ [Lawsonibacter sp.]